MSIHIDVQCSINDRNKLCQCWFYKCFKDSGALVVVSWSNFINFCASRWHLSKRTSVRTKPTSETPVSAKHRLAVCLRKKWRVLMCNLQPKMHHRPLIRCECGTLWIQTDGDWPQCVCHSSNHSESNPKVIVRHLWRGHIHSCSSDVSSCGCSFNWWQKVFAHRTIKF